MSQIVQQVILAFVTHHSNCAADPERFFQKTVGKSSAFALRLSIDTAEQTKSRLSSGNPSAGWRLVAL
jgi:hypothetical protein